MIAIYHTKYNTDLNTQKKATELSVAFLKNYQQ